MYEDPKIHITDSYHGGFVEDHGCPDNLPPPRACGLMHGVILSCAREPPHQRLHPEQSLILSRLLQVTAPARPECRPMPCGYAALPGGAIRHSPGAICGGEDAPVALPCRRLNAIFSPFRFRSERLKKGGTIGAALRGPLPGNECRWLLNERRPKDVEHDFNVQQP